MTLEQVQELASTPIFASDPDADMKRRRRAERLAEFAHAVIPLVRAAVAWSESFGELSKRLPPHVHELRNAVDEYERQIHSHTKASR